MLYKNLILAFFISTILLSACATTGTNENLSFDSLYFENKSNHTIDEVKISVEQTGAFASCSPVLKGATCSTRFPPRHYQGNPVYVTWTYQGVIHQEGPFVIEPPQQIIKDHHAKIIIHFGMTKQLSIKMMY